MEGRTRAGAIGEHIGTMALEIAVLSMGNKGRNERGR
jgi:hypothetical protein